MSQKELQEGPDGHEHSLHPKMQGIVLKTIFDLSTNGIAVLKAVRNEKGDIVDFEWLAVNAKAGILESDIELPGKKYKEQYPETMQKGLFEKYKAVVGKDIIANFEQHFQYNGTEGWSRIHAVKVDDGLVVISEDITDKKIDGEKINKLNQELTLKNRELESLNSELKTFNSIAANDYNETLRHLYTSLEFAITNDARNLSNEGKGHLRRAQSWIQKMKLLTDDIISYSNLQVGNAELSEVDLNLVVRNSLVDLDVKIKQADADVNHGHLPNIKGYPDLLTLLFHHLVDNAIKFRKPDVKSSMNIVHSTASGKNTDHPAVLKDWQYDIISISDNGIGFKTEDQEKLFTIFYRPHEKSKYKGSGIGLAICKKIMNMHNGFITAETARDFTTFHCYFPISKL